MKHGPVPDEPRLDRLSIELTNHCSKACSFCYNHSHPEGATAWTLEELVPFIEDCVRHGVRAISLGGGEPLQVPELYELLGRLQGLCFRSFTTNGLLLDEAMDAVVDAAPDKVHVSIHFPRHGGEVRRVIRQVNTLRDRGIPAGVNLLVRRSQLEAARAATVAMAEADIGPERIMFLPMRGLDTPTPRELQAVAGTPQFQSMTCLMACAASPRFASIGWDKTVAWCSYTTSRLPMASLNYEGLMATLRPLNLATC